MNRQLKELYSLFDEMLNAIEKKEESLRGLISLADEKIKTLQSLLREKDEDKDDFLSQPKVRETISLYKEGKSIREISERTGIHKGEVELIINLYRTRYESRSN